MSKNYPPVLTACLSAGAVVAGMVGYLLMPPIAGQLIATAFSPQPPSPQVAVQHPEVRRITAEEAKLLSNAFFVDVRSQGEYERGHIKGALWAPFEKIQLQADQLPKDRAIVLYCT